MSLIECPKCKNRFDDKADECPLCGQAVDKSQKVDNAEERAQFWINVSLVVMVVTIPFLGLSVMANWLLWVGLLAFVGVAGLIYNVKRLRDARRRRP